MRRKVTFTGIPALIVIAGVFALQWWAIETRSDRYERRGVAARANDSRQAAMVAAQMADLQLTARASNGAELVEAFVAQNTERLGRPLVEDHRITASTGRRGYRVGVTARPGGGPEFRLAVDQGRGIVEATCDPGLGCRDGRWDPQDQAGIGPVELLAE